MKDWGLIDFEDYFVVEVLDGGHIASESFPVGAENFVARDLSII